MIPLALGVGAVAVLVWGASAFSRAGIASLKALGTWVAVLAGLSLVALLVLTGRGGVGLGGAALGGLLAWTFWLQYRARSRAASPPQPRLGRREAHAVLGLAEGASDADVQAAWVRLMRAVHPDGGGTDWLAARVNQARDVLLRR